jgi:hypothetical protein
MRVQVNDAIEVQRADVEALFRLRRGHDRGDRVVHCRKIDCDSINGEIALNGRVQDHYVDPWQMKRVRCDERMSRHQSRRCVSRFDQFVSVVIKSD